MYDAHVNTAEQATQKMLADEGVFFSQEIAGKIFRDAAEEWARTRDLSDIEAVEAAADRFFYEISLEN